MNLGCLYSLGDGITFHRFRKNPFRPAGPGRPSILLPVKPVSAQPVQPALDDAGAPRARGRPSRAEQLEALVLKLILLLLVLASLGCGFGIQHIAYVRQKNELGRQLRQKELELRAVTQAYRSLESLTIAKAAEDLRRPGTCPVWAKREPLKGPPRG